MIIAKSLSVRIGDKTLLDDISLECKAGECTVIVGENGAGKTTLLDALSGVRESNKSVHLLGRALEDYSNQERAKVIASLAQFESGRSALSVKERIAHGLIPERGHSALYDDKTHARVRAAASLTGVSPLLARSLRNLSGGERRRTDVARVLIANAQCIVVDEPYARTDIASRALITRALRQKCDEGVCVIASVHDLSAAFTLADAVVGLRKGRVVCRGTPEEVLNRDGLELIFNKRAQTFESEFGRAFVFEP